MADISGTDKLLADTAHRKLCKRGAVECQRVIGLRTCFNIIFVICCVVALLQLVLLLKVLIAWNRRAVDPRQQLVNIPPPQSTAPGLHPVSIYQMAPP